MAKKVRYNGGTESWSTCSDPTELVVGKVYEIVSSKDCGWQTNYTLKGVTGEFNSTWFDEIVYKAIATGIPVIGESYNCCKLNEKLEGLLITTSPVKEIDHMGNNIYKVTTCNNVYIVMVV